MLKKRYGIEKERQNKALRNCNQFLQVTTWYSVMKLADENKNGNLSLREFKKLVDLAEDINSKKKKEANNEG